MQNYKFLNHIVLCNVFFAIICIPTAGKLIDVVGSGKSEPPIPEILSRFVFSGKVSSRLR
jgi:hypothetical protein